ncbi:MAG: hypothetical protein ACYSWP_17235, partial [Planctomycetota bacterium]
MLNKNKISRRNFLTATTATVAFPYVIPSSALGLTGTIAPSNRITMGCIGVGGKGTGDMVAFLKKPEIQMLAVCDVYQHLRQRAKEIVDKQYA